ncbi:response regulator transcription factor [Clostridium grantii]|uniref:Stage 0 sporulation protein A homolog n=1 Tax=Clostridium grantii DSM 8605 TaxID=1121316 RepID=A0A1M5XRZ8_9CLOT|nr:response regulator [Clostridium grantii]SHI02605.1 Two-component response regulator, YesN/AraC family, consists of REC and AraC-type DNA-binding domains [Clostridium grantii DSM 8605]
MKVLMVDDQRVVLEGLKELISWGHIGVESLYLAESAAEAKVIAKETHIDILITDIEMPVESGIQLMNWFRKKYPEIPCIFLTSHADFSYVKEAIRNHGFDYVLQPAKPDEIEGVIKRCIEYLEKDREMRNLAQKGISYDDTHEKVVEGLAENIFEGSEEDLFLQEKWEKEVNRECIYKWYLPVLITLENNNRIDIKKLLTKFIEGKYPFVCTEGRKTINYWRYGLIICGIGDNPQEKFIHTLFSELYNYLSSNYKVKVMIYVGNTACMNLLDMVAQLKKSCENNVFLNTGVVLVKEKRNALKLRMPDKEEWKQWMLNGDGQLIQNEIKNLLENAEQVNKLTLDYTKKIYALFVDVWIICCYLKNVNGREWFDESYQYEEFQQAFHTVQAINEAVEFIINRFNKVLEQDSKDKSEISSGERIKLICSYINENLEKNILRSEVSSMVYLSEDYFSKVFKLETGYGFKEYILMQKIQYCKKLLNETNYPVGVIAGKVGYDNFSNFSQIFKKFTGKTPHEYRSEN